MIRTSVTQFVALLLIATGAACKKSASVDAAAKTPVANAAMEVAADAALDTSLVASLERGPCHGTCPVYRVELYGDGKVRFEGRRFVGDSGVRNGTTTVSAVQDFMRSVASSEFATADTSYVMDSAGCGTYATDLPTQILSVKVGARMKTVQQDFGCRDAPKYLRVLAAQLDTAARTAPWIAGTGEKK